MAITPKPGYITDPNNPNGVIVDPNAEIGIGGAPIAPAPAPTTAPTSAGDAQVLANQQAAAKLGISIPGVGSTPSAPAPTSVAAATPISPDDQKLLAMGITPEQLKQLNTPEGLDPTSFQNLIGNVENKLKTNNDLVTQRGYLMKQLYDSPLTPDQLKQLPEDLQRVIGSGNKDAMELQMRLLNDQISGRANTLTQSIGYLADTYQTHVKDVENQKNQAMGTVLDFVQQYGSKAPEVLSSLYGPAYLDKLKAMGIDVAHMSKITTLAQDKAEQDAALAREKIGQGSGTEETRGVIDTDVQAILEGRNTMYNIRQTMGRTNAAAAYMQKVREQITAIDPNFDFVASDAGGRSVSTGYVQKATAAINSVLPNINTLVDLSNQVSRVGITGVDKIIQAGNIVVGDKKVANFHEAQKLIADEIGIALGAGTVSDMKLQLGFDVTDPSMSQEVFASNMALVKEFLNNRKAGLDSLRYSSSVTGPNYAGSNNTNNVTKTDFTDVLPKITLDDTKKEAYIPRSVWSTLGSRMDDLVKEFEADGYKLLVK